MAGRMTIVAIAALFAGCTATNRVQIRSVPPGAELYCNGDYRGRTPQDVIVKRSLIDTRVRDIVISPKHFELRMPGYESASRRFEYVTDFGGSGWDWSLPPEYVFRLRPILETHADSPPGTTQRDNVRQPPGTLLPHAVRNVHVLVVGIDDYKDPSIPRLRHTETDAKGVHEFFKTSGLSPARSSNVHYLGDDPNEDGLSATRLGIRKAITSYLINKAVNIDDMAILYFAGHGDTGKHPTKGTEYYLIPSDAERADLFNTAIELSEFKRLWSAIRAETKILIADACNSGGFTGVRALDVKGIEGIEAEGGGKIVFSASKADQKSLEVPELGHGLFTHVMLEGLKGKADKVCGDNDGRVTAGELKRYLDEQVPAQARKYGGNQTPVTQMLDAWGKVYLTR